MGRRGAAPPAAARPRDHAFEKLAFWLAVALLLVLPLIWDGDSIEVFRVPKRELAFAIWATLAAAFVAGNLGGTAWRDPWWWAWAGVLAGAVASAAASEHPGVVLLRCLPLALAALGWGALRQLDERHRRRLVTLVIVAGVTQAVLTAAFTLPAFQPELFAHTEELTGRYMWIGTLGNPADVGVFLVPPIMLAAALALRSRRGRAVTLAAIGVMLGAVLGTRTLTAVIALAAGAAVLLWRLVPRRWRIPAVAGVVLLALVATMGPLRQRVLLAVSEFQRGGWWSIGSGRGAGYAAAFGMIAARPVAGVGFGLFESNYYRFQPEEVLARRARLLRLETAFGQAHNEPLQYAAETGLLGVLLAGAGIALAVRRRPSGPSVLPARLPLLVAAAPLALLQFPLHLATSAAQWTILAALALPPLPAPPPGSRRGTALRWLAVVAVAAAASLVAWRRLEASVAWQQASTLTRAIQRGQLKTGRSETARAALARLEPRLAWFPGAWDAHVVTGSVAMAAGRPDTALSHFESALALAERPECRYNVGMALLALGDRESGLAHIVRAIKLNPVMFWQIENAELAADVRRRLEADGYGVRESWIFRPESRNR